VHRTALNCKLVQTEISLTCARTSHDIQSGSIRNLWAVCLALSGLRQRRLWYDFLAALAELHKIGEAGRGWRLVAVRHRCAEKPFGCACRHISVGRPLLKDVVI